MCLCFLDCIEHIGILLASAQPDDESLEAAVSLLEANWTSIQEIFELASHVLTRISIELWPKQRVDIENADLKKLVKAFDTPEDPILLMNGRSVKRGAKGAIALAYAHGVEVDWEKVSSFRGRPLSELRGFFERVKKVHAKHRVDYFTFGGFFDFCACFFNSFLWCDDASSRNCCYICVACHGA
jgi:hypothetical protein